MQAPIFKHQNANVFIFACKPLYSSDQYANVDEEIGRQNFPKRELNSDLEQSALYVPTSSFISNLLQLGHKYCGGEEWAALCSCRLDAAGGTHK
jgi:hypothetical protein